MVSVLCHDMQLNHQYAWSVWHQYKYDQVYLNPISNKHINAYIWYNGFGINLNTHNAINLNALWCCKFIPTSASMEFESVWKYSKIRRIAATCIIIFDTS